MRRAQYGVRDEEGAKRSAQARESRGSCRGAEQDRESDREAEAGESDGRGPHVKGPTGRARGEIVPPTCTTGTLCHELISRRGGSGSQGRSPQAQARYHERVGRGGAHGAPGSGARGVYNV